MKIRIGLIICCLLSCVFAPHRSAAQESGPPDLQQSCRSFVRHFYDWYSPTASTESAVPAPEVAVRKRASAFSGELIQELKEDSAAQQKAGGKIVGLDFDPFLNSQDPGERYVPGSTRVNDNTCLVDVHGIWSGKKSTKPNVTPELELKNGHWIFVNFHYPSPPRPEFENLLALLRSLRLARQSQSR